MSNPFGPPPNHAATVAFPRGHHLLAPPVDSQQILPNVACVSERELSPCLQYRQSSVSSSVREGISLNEASIIPCVFHTMPRPSHGGHIISGAWSPASTSQPLRRSFASGIQSISYPNFPSNVPVQVECSEHNWSDNDESCGTISGHTGSVVMQGVYIGVDRQQQLEVVDALQGDNGCVEEDVHLLTPSILHDASLLLSIAPNILDKSLLYNENWSSWDMIEFNGILIDESEIICQWAGPRSTCNEHLQVKNIKIHIAHKHGVQYNSQLYRCSWNECSVSKPMTGSSLARHVRERHSFVKWACPSCDETFTREHTLLGHFKGVTRCRPGHSIRYPAEKISELDTATDFRPQNY